MYFLSLRVNLFFIIFFTFFRATKRFGCGKGKISCADSDFRYFVGIWKSGRLTLLFGGQTWVGSRRIFTMRKNFCRFAARVRISGKCIPALRLNQSPPRFRTQRQNALFCLPKFPRRASRGATERELRTLQKESPTACAGISTNTCSRRKPPSPRTDSRFLRARARTARLCPARAARRKNARAQSFCARRSKRTDSTLRGLSASSSGRNSNGRQKESLRKRCGSWRRLPSFREYRKKADSAKLAAHPAKLQSEANKKRQPGFRIAFLFFACCAVLLFTRSATAFCAARFCALRFLLNAGASALFFDALEGECGQVGI